MPSRRNHRLQVAQRTGEAVRALGEQAQGHAHATDELSREASRIKDEATTYVSNRQEAEAQAQADSDEMSCISDSKDEETKDCC